MSTFFNKQKIVFDLDGTLVDSAPDLTHALNHVMRQLGLNVVPLDDVRHMVGQGARRLIEQGLLYSGGEPDGFDMDAALAQFLSYYRDHIAEETRPFPMAVELLEGLRARQVRLGLCTNKPQAMTEVLMEKLGLAAHFDAMVGGDALSVRKPHSRHLIETLNRIPGNGPALMIGDTAIDVAAARGADVPIIVVNLGYSEIDPHTLGADHVATDFAELHTLLIPRS